MQPRKFRSSDVLSGILSALLAFVIGIVPAPATSSPLEGRAAAGDLHAIAELAARLELGIDTAPDPSRALALFCRAGAGGNRAAAYHVAAWLLTDTSPDYSPDRAAIWLRHIQRLERGVQPARGDRPPPCPVNTAPGLPPASPGRTAGAAGTYASLAGTVETLAATYGVDPALVKSLITVESGFDRGAVSPAGAAGLMQLMPGTARALGVVDRFDPEQNLRGGISHLASLLRRFGGSVPLALAAYNAGETAVEACGCVPDNGETPHYVRRVRAVYDARR